MGSPGVLIAVVVAVVVIGAYVVWVVARYRKEQAAKREALAAAEAIPPMGRFPIPPVPTRTDPATAVAPPVPPPGPGAAAPVTAPTGAGPGYPSVPPGEATTVAALLAGIVLPCDLVPSASFVRRAEVVDEVVFVTDSVPVEVLRPQLEAALAAIGVTVTWVGHDRADLVRDGRRGAMQLPDSPTGVRHGTEMAYGALPPAAVVADIWTV